MSQFPTITSDHWRRAIQRARATKNDVAAQIKAALSKPKGP